ncbi:MAG: hypothetical protein HYY18_22860 [Planctomycetes bacterium]|nr:hypothetical protein [Planctomycetota bacterium]
MTPAEDARPERVNGILGAIAWAAALIHAGAAFAMLLVLRQGFDPALTPAERAAWISGHPVLWRGGWAFWIAGALSLIAFYAAWGARLPSRLPGRLAVAIAACGALFDIGSEIAFIVRLPRDLETVSRLGTFYTTVVANGLYCVAGSILTLATPGLPSWLRALTWTLWTAGFAMAAAGAFAWLPGIQATTALLSVLLPPWFVLLAARLGTSPNGCLPDLQSPECACAPKNKAGDPHGPSRPGSHQRAGQ